MTGADVTQPETTALPRGVELVNGKPHMRDAKGRLTPVELISAVDLMIDAFVRDRNAKAAALSLKIAAFRDETFREVTALRELLLEKYGAKKGGEKGNVTFTTVDGLERVQVQVADRLTFGPELQAAKALIDECLTEWSADGRAELRRVVMDAFNVDKEGQVNRARILGLRRLDIDDERWKRAMQAIDDSRRVAQTAEYSRHHHRKTPEAPWKPIPLDAATA